jgi:hypothetical protein
MGTLFVSRGRLQTGQRTAGLESRRHCRRIEGGPGLPPDTYRRLVDPLRYAKSHPRGHLYTASPLLLCPLLEMMFELRSPPKVMIVLPLMQAHRSSRRRLTRWLSLPDLLGANLGTLAAVLADPQSENTSPRAAVCSECERIGFLVGVVENLASRFR